MDPDTLLLAIMQICEATEDPAARQKALAKLLEGQKKSSAALSLSSQKDKTMTMPTMWELKQLIGRQCKDDCLEAVAPALALYSLGEIDLAGLAIACFTLGCIHAEEEEEK